MDIDISQGPTIPLMVPREYGERILEAKERGGLDAFNGPIQYLGGVKFSRIIEILVDHEVIANIEVGWEFPVSWYRRIWAWISRRVPPCGPEPRISFDCIQLFDATSHQE